MLIILWFSLVWCKLRRKFEQYLLLLLSPVSTFASKRSIGFVAVCVFKVKMIPLALFDFKGVVVMVTVVAIVFNVVCL